MKTYGKKPILDSETAQTEQTTAIPDHHLFQSGELGCVLDVPQVGVLSRQLLSDSFVLWVLRSQNQARVVAQLPQVLQCLSV